MGSNEDSWTEIIAALIELIEGGDVNIISSKDSSNIYINRFGFMSVEYQVDDLKNLKGDRNFCCYPSSSYLEAHRDVSEYKNRPFDEMLALGTAQLEIQYFQWDVLDKYSEDPRFGFEFRDYEGEIYVTDSLPESEYIYLKSFGTGRDSNEKRIIVAFTRYLRNMSTANQIHWYSKMIDRTGCKHIEAYFDNMVLGHWYFPDSAYTAILKEMTNVNQIALHIWNKTFFKKEFLDDRPKDFGVIFNPTLKRYNSFLLILDIIISDNIDPSFFDIVHISGTKPDGAEKKTIKRLREWLKVVDTELEPKITESIRKIRKLRQIPAHKIEINRYDYSFFDQQHNIVLELLESLILFRRLLLTHPKAQDLIIKHKNEIVIIA